MKQPPIHIDLNVGESSSAEIEFSLILAKRAGKDKDMRHYYHSCDTKYNSSGLRIVLVLRNGLRIDDLKHGVLVDAAVGTEEGTRGYVPNEFTGKRHLKITIFSILDEDYESIANLSAVIGTAPNHIGQPKKTEASQNKTVRMTKETIQNLNQINPHSLAKATEEAAAFYAVHHVYLKRLGSGSAADGIQVLIDSLDN